MAKGAGGGGRVGGRGFKGSPGEPRAYAATVSGQKLNTMEFIRKYVIPVQKKLIAMQRPYRPSQGEYKRLEAAIEKLAQARYFETLERPSGTREEVYAAAARVIEQYGQ